MGTNEKKVATMAQLENQVASANQALAKATSQHTKEVDNFKRQIAQLQVELEGLRPGPVESSAGFLLSADDPYAPAALRHYFGGQKTISELRGKLPLVLRYNNPATERALQAYIAAASGAGSVEAVRVAGARAALAKC